MSRRTWLAPLSVLPLALALSGCWSAQPSYCKMGAPDCGGPREKDEPWPDFVDRYQRANALKNHTFVDENDPVVTGVRAQFDHLVARAKAANMPLPDRVHLDVIVDPEPIAFAERGGYVYISTGTLTRAFNCEEVSGVLAHELAHVHFRHPYERFNPVEDSQTTLRVVSQDFYSKQPPEKKAEIDALFATRVARMEQDKGRALTPKEREMARTIHLMNQGGASPAQMLVAGGLFTALFSADQPYNSRADEDQADAAALRLLQAANLPGRPLGQYFDRNARAAGACPGAFYSAHPDLRDRADQILARTAEGSALKCDGRWDYNKTRRRLSFEQYTTRRPAE